MFYLNYFLGLKKYKFMVSQLVNRDFKVRYRGSVLGVLWSVLNPLLNMVVLSIVFSRVFNQVDNYKMYLLGGLVIFNYYSEASNSALTSIVSNFGLITKVYMPKYLLPVAKILSSGINLIMSILAFIILGSFMGVHIWVGYLLIPYMILCLMMFAAGMGLILSALQVFMRDIQYLYGILMTVWMYSTPILYPLDIIPENLVPLFKANPLYIFIDFFRQITLYTTIPTFESFVKCFLCAAIALVIGLVVFKKTQDSFIYYT